MFGAVTAKRKEFRCVRCSAAPLLTATCLTIKESLVHGNRVDKCIALEEKSRDTVSEGLFYDSLEFVLASDLKETDLSTANGSTVEGVHHIGVKARHARSRHLTNSSYY